MKVPRLGWSKRYRESSGSVLRKDAVSLLRKRMAEMG